MGLHPQLGSVRGTACGVDLNRWEIKLYNPRINLDQIGGLWTNLANSCKVTTFNKAIKQGWIFDENISRMIHPRTQFILTLEEMSKQVEDKYPVTELILVVPSTSRVECRQEYEQRKPEHKFKQYVKDPKDFSKDTIFLMEVLEEQKNVIQDKTQLV